MSLRDDERGQAIQVGAVLLFAVLIIAFSSYQAVIIPADNRRVEFNHNQAVQEQLTELRNAVLAATNADGSRSVTVALGTQYPSRTLGLNPNSPAGSLRTVGTTDPAVGLTIENATASGETGDRWDGTALSYNTGAIRYSPIYNRYDEAPRTLYDHSVLYNRFGAGNTLVLANQTVVDGDRLSIITLNGSLDRSASTATSVDVRPVSASSETILVEAAGSNTPLTLTFTSTLSAGEWERILSDEQNVVDVSGSASPAGSDFYDVRVELATGVEYQLGMTKAAVGQGATAEGPAYLTDESGDGASIQRGSSHQVTLSVRDRYNNPVSGVSVNGSVDGANSGSLDSNRKTTGTDGRVTFTYATTGSTATETHQLNFTTNSSSALSARPFDDGRPKNASVDVTVTTASGGGGGGAYTVDWTAPDAESANSGAALSNCSPDSCTWDVGSSDDETLMLNATLSPAFNGVELEFALSNTSVGTLAPTTNETSTNGAASTTLTADDNGIVEVLASGNEGGDTIEITVQGISQGGIEYVDGTGSAARAGSESRVDFDIRNAGSSDVTITGIQVDSSSGSLASIYESNGGSGPGQHEVYIASNDPGLLEIINSNGYQLGTDATLTDSATLTAGEQAQVTMLDFRNNGGNTVSAADRPLTVTLYFQNGESTTFTFTPPGY